MGGCPARFCSRRVLIVEGHGDDGTSGGLVVSNPLLKLTLPGSEILAAAVCFNSR
jgi:hypothetical protein